MESLAAFSSPESQRKTRYYSGDKVKFKEGDREGTGELRYNGWSIYDLKGTEKLMDINSTALNLKKLTMTLDENSPQSNHDFSGGKRSRRKSRRSNKSLKFRR